MISRFDIEERVREWGLREEVVEKDYVIGWVLWGIGRHPVLRDAWVFKGGTCLKKCYIETYRFSEDLDFTVLPNGPVLPDDVRPLLVEVLNDVEENTGINFKQQEPLLKGHASGNYIHGRVYYVGPRVARNVAAIKLDLSASERVVRPTEFRQISHAYPDVPAKAGTVRCYSFVEVFAEKIRAMGERGRPRDLYDIVNLYRRQDADISPDELRTVLIEKCESKGVDVPTIDSVQLPERRGELEAEWANMLQHQLPELPPFQSFIDELGALFEWLEGVVERPVLSSIAPYRGDEDPQWVPPSTIRTWGYSVPLETIRFAAVNQLLVELGYKGSFRAIEPYSLRTTRAGNILLYGIRADNEELRAYRVDRIESARATNVPFRPRYRIEFAATGMTHAPPTNAASLSEAVPKRGRRRRSRLTADRPYTIECPVCGKTFTRSRPGNRKLNEHKTPDGYRCPGSGRNGYSV